MNGPLTEQPQIAPSCSLCQDTDRDGARLEQLVRLRCGQCGGSQLKHIGVASDTLRRALVKTLQRLRARQYAFDPLITIVRSVQ